MSILSRGNSQNTLVGLFLLLMLAVFAAPNLLPRLIAQVVPIFDEALPCEWLRQSDDRGSHQSWIGNAASALEAPFSIGVTSSTFPTTSGETLLVRVIVINNTIGTVPIVVPAQIPDLNAGQPGVGAAFNYTGAIPPANPQGAIPADQLRLLGPRQRCIQRIEYRFEDLAALGINPTSTVKGYYRNASGGQITGAANPFTSPGIWTGVVESEPLTFSEAE